MISIFSFYHIRSTAADNRSAAPSLQTAEGEQAFSGVRPRRGRREGEVTVSGKDATAGEKIVGDHIGEYVDYEEVEEKK